MIRNIAKAAAVAAASGLAIAAAPAVAAAQPQPIVAGSVEIPTVVPRPFDLPVWQLPPVPHPFVWDMNVPHASAPAPPAPKYGDTCTPEQVYDVYDRKLVCVYAGRSIPSWVYVSPKALHPDGTLNLDYPAA